MARVKRFGHNYDEQVFFCRYFAAEAKDCARRVIPEIAKAHTIPANIIQTAREVASAWLAVADELERRRKSNR